MPEMRKFLEASKYSNLISEESSGIAPLMEVLDRSTYDREESSESSVGMVPKIIVLLRSSVAKLVNALISLGR